jgi:hypothetical protein
VTSSSYRFAVSRFMWIASSCRSSAHIHGARDGPAQHGWGRFGLEGQTRLLSAGPEREAQNKEDFFRLPTSMDMG